MGTKKIKALGGFFRLLPAAAFAWAILSPSSASFAEEIESVIADGGKLFNNWIEITEADDPPMKTNPAYPTDKGRMRKAKSWRCVECHGWDYKGKDGMYAEGKHATGIKGIRESDGADPAKIAAVLGDENHALTEEMIMAEEIEALALFVGKGLIDMDKYIDPASKEVKGDKVKGQMYFNTLCAGCHGLDGKLQDDMPALGAVTNDNPWRALHSIRNGQPGENMPALRALPVEVAVDVLSYAITLPQ